MVVEMQVTVLKAMDILVLNIMYLNLPKEPRM
nr:MAG TPA: hypothetical protein [Caudoviricetes sp.]